MDILKLISFEFLLFLSIHARKDRPLFCGKNPVEIRFPFRLQDQQPQKCGYPGFDLSCQESNIALYLPYSGDYYVRDINYLVQEIYLYDPNGCLPSRLLSLNISSSPFMAAYSKNFTFLSCPSELVSTRLTINDCLSNSTSSVLATSSMNLPRALNICSTIVTLSIPVSQPVQDEEWLSSDLNDDLRLLWSTPSCEDCEARGGICGFDNSTSTKIVCHNHPKEGQSRVKEILKIIGLTLLAPFSISICYVCKREAEGSTTSPPPSLPPPPPPPPATTAFEGSMSPPSNPLQK